MLEATTIAPAKIVLPWRAAPSRLDAFERVVAWYADHFPDLPIETVDTDDDPFVLAACRNRAMAEAAPDQVVVIGDADTLPEPAALREAIAAARDSPFVHLPYDEYRWLGREGSAQYAAGTPLVDCAHDLVEGACSGVYVATPRTWASHGGQDERFRGWGFEDAAWFLAHTTLLGAPPQRHAGRVYALHHIGEVRAGAAYDANAARMEEYRLAAGDPDAMAQLVGLPSELDERVA
ncbi:glycosyltransferase family protein [Microbacterium aureliae]